VGIKVRRGSAEDLPDLLDMSEEFYNQSSYQKIIPFNRDHISIVLRNLLGDSGVVQVAELDGRLVGMIVGVRSPFPMNAEHTMVSELGFYAKPEARGTGVGKQLVRKFEQVSKQIGAKLVVLSSLSTVDNRAANSLYLRCGYAPNETSFLKEI